MLNINILKGSCFLNEVNFTAYLEYPALIIQEALPVLSSEAGSSTGFC